MQWSDIKHIDFNFKGANEIAWRNKNPMFTRRNAAYQRSWFGPVVPLFLILLLLFVILVGRWHLAAQVSLLPPSPGHLRLYVLCTKPKALILFSLWKKGGQSLDSCAMASKPTCQGVPSSMQQNGRQRVPEKLVYWTDRPSLGRALSRGGKEVLLSQQLGNPPQQRCAQLCSGALRRRATRLPAISSE